MKTTFLRPWIGTLAAAFAGSLLLVPNIYLSFLGNALNYLAVSQVLWLLLAGLLLPHICPEPHVRGVEVRNRHA